MWTLGIETSGRAGSIALQQGDRFVDQRDLDAAGRRHARSLVPEIAELLKQNSLSAADLGLVAVSVGPGSFTGLRVGVVCAKTLVYAVPSLKLAGVDTFLAVAEAAPEGISRLEIFDDALREEIFAGAYVKSSGRWHVESAARLQGFEDWQRGLPEGAMIAGPGVERLRKMLPADLKLAPETCWAPQARYVAQVGYKLWQTGRLADPWTLEPFYIRRSAAEEKADLATADRSQGA